MQTLIVLCAGSRMINGLPLYLNTHPDGKLLVEKAIEGIQPHRFDRIIYTITQDANIKFDSKRKLISILKNKYPVEVCVLPEVTSGPAETVYKTIRLSSVTGAFAVRDCHNFIAVDGELGGNYIAGLDLISYEGTIENLRNKSFIVLNEQGQVLDIIEKKLCSDVISVGLYGFKRADDFLVAYEHLNDKNYPIKKLYVSHIISFLIGYSQRVFHSLNVKVFEDWGTPSAWAKVQKNHTLCFVCFDNLDSADMMNLRIASESGCQFVFYSSRSNLNHEKEINGLKEKGVNALQIVSNCTYSNSHLLADSSETLNQLAVEVGK